MNPVASRSLARLGLTLAALGLTVAARASTAIPNELGFHYRLLNVGSVNTLEISLRPKRDFAEVTLEAGSGVAAFSPECHFDALTAGTLYHCRIEVTGSPGDAAMTLRMTADHPRAGTALVTSEQHLVSIANAAFVRSAATASASRHALRATPRTP
jgi:hypothetical protein